MLSKPTVGSGRMRSASSSDSTSPEVAKTASSDALMQRCKPLSERTGVRTASAMPLFREGRVGSPELRRIGSRSAACKQRVQSIARRCQSNMTKCRLVVVPSAKPQQHRAQHRRCGRRAVLARQHRLVTRSDVRIASRWKCRSELQSCRVRVRAERSVDNRVLGLQFVSRACRQCVAQVRALGGALCFHRDCNTCARSPRKVFPCGKSSEFSGTLSWREQTAGKHTLIEHAASTARSRYRMHAFVP